MQNQSQPKKRIDARRLIADLGGAERLTKRLQDAGIEITAKAVEKWRERGHLPMVRWLQIAEMVRKTQRRSLVLDDYVI